MSAKLLRISLIVPLFNEEKTITEVLRKVTKLVIPHVRLEIIVVDDGSTDASSSKVTTFINRYQTKNITFVSHKGNRGKGAAIKTGIQKARGEYILIQDADSEYDPKYIKQLVLPVLKEEATVVYGSRLMRRPYFTKDERTPRFFLHYVGNKFLSLLTSIFYGQWLTDMETGYKLFPRKAVENIELHSRGFEIEPEITAKLLKKGYHILEVPIRTNPRGYKEGKKLRTIPDGTKAFLTLIKYRFVN